MVLWWPDEGVDHSRTMLVTEISHLDNEFRRSVVSSEPARFAKRFADNSYHYLFEVTRFMDFTQWVSLSPRKYEQGVRATLHTVYKPTAEYVLAMMHDPGVLSAPCSFDFGDAYFPAF